MSNLFAKVEQDAFRAGISPRTKQSRDWFRKKLGAMGKVNRNQLMRDEQVKLVNKSQPLIGSMNMFFYDPKHKDTLPYYDRFPLSVIVACKRWFLWIKFTLPTTCTSCKNVRCVNGCCKQ